MKKRATDIERMVEYTRVSLEIIPPNVAISRGNDFKGMNES